MKNNIQKVNKKNAGFTLLELVVVVGIMGLMSAMAMDLYTDKSNQKRYELTKQRLAEIKFAIIGDASRDLISGYVVDEGQLPENINALLYKNYCTKTNFFSDTSCSSNGGSWKETVNWNGPYLRNRQTDNNGNYVFKDSWGNAFEYSIIDNKVVVYSLGLDRLRNISDASKYNAQNPYEQDYPKSNSASPTDNPEPLITQNEFYKTIELGSIVTAYVTLKNETELDISSSYFCLAIRKDSTSDIYLSYPISVTLLITDPRETILFGRLINTDTNSPYKYLEKNVNNINSTGVNKNEFLIVSSTSSTCDSRDWSKKMYAGIYRRERTSFEEFILN